jgi:GT2 family glycosyltransferase/glycosyltransferase involved in cell wall biosynthesis
MKLDIIIPVYRNAAMVRDCIRSLVPHLAEISDCAPRLIVINDSPDDEDVERYLASSEAVRSIGLILRNKENLGFVRSVNKGLALARQRGAAALLVNSDTLTYPGTLAEMVAVLHADPQIAFVCPRSNNAALSTFPQMPNPLCDADSPPETCHRAWQMLRHHLPRYTLAPTAVGFYMLIADHILRNFDPLDEEFGVGYEEENDLVMRAGKLGYRAAMANHAYAYHAGSASFLLKDMDLRSQQEGNLTKMIERHPEFLPLVRAYEGTVDYRAETQLKSLLPTPEGRRKVALNLLTMGTHHNGTNELIVNVIRWLEANPPRDFDIHAICKPGVAEFHGFADFKSIHIEEKIRPDYALSIFFGQPFDLHIVNLMEYLAPINIYGMLDVIALDCSNLRGQDDIEPMWRHVAENADGVFFISEFSGQTFRNRFARHFRTNAYTRLLPTRLSAYREAGHSASGGSDHVLVMGNHFKHKASQAVGHLLAAALPDMPIVAMGGVASKAGNLTFAASGAVPEAEMDALFANASVIVLPSHYEGFGLGLVHALSRGKPVVVRDIAPVREILESYHATEGVFLFNDDQDLPALVAEAARFGRSSADDRGAADWNDWASGFWAFAETLFDDPALMERLLRRIESSDALKLAHRLKDKDDIAFQPEGQVRQVSLAVLFALPDEIFVQSLYKNFLGRPADPSGLDHYVLSLRNGASKKKVTKAIMRSDEYKANASRIHIVDRWRLML